MDVVWVVFWNFFTGVFSSREKAIDYVNETAKKHNLKIQWDRDKDWLIKFCEYDNDENIVREFYIEEVNFDPTP